MKKEFKIGDTVTLDRYNHIDDVEKVKVVGYGEMIISKQLTYKLDVKGIIIESTGVSIKESKFYESVADEDRGPKLKSSAQDMEDYWNAKRAEWKREP